MDYPQTSQVAKLAPEEEPVLVRLDRLQSEIHSERGERVDQSAALDERLTRMERVMGLRGRP